MTQLFDAKQLNGLSLAFIGDAVLENYIRRYLIVEKQMTKVNNMQTASKRFVSAKAQAAVFAKMEENNFLTEDEMAIFKHGRNSNIHTKAKNTDIVTYKISTGVESLIGYLELTDNKDRLQEVIDFIIENVEIGRDTK